MPYKLPNILDIFLAHLTGLNYLLFGASLMGLILLPWLSKACNRIVPFLLVWSLSDILALFTAIIFKNNSPIFHAYSLVGTVFILVYYYPQLKNLPYMKSVFLFGMVGYFLIWLFNFLFFQTLNVFPRNIIMFSCLLILFFVLMSFKYMLDHPIEESIFVQAQFWFNTGILIFYSSSFLYFFFESYLQKIGQYPIYLLHVIRYPNIIWVICIIIGMLGDLGVFPSKKPIHDGNEL